MSDKKSVFEKATSWVAKEVHEYKENRANQAKKDIDNDLAWGLEDDNARMSASDNIEFHYQYKHGTTFHNDIISRLKKFKDVSSPSATNRRANVMIWLSLVGKFASIYVTYVSLLYIYNKSLGTTLAIPDMLETSAIFGLAIMWEWFSSSELKAIFNTTEDPLSRTSGAVLGVFFTIAGLYLHIWYQDLQFSTAKQENSTKVLQVETPQILAQKEKIKNIELQIKQEQSRLDGENQLAKDKRSAIDSQIYELETKRDFYKQVLEDIDNKKRKTWKRKGVVYTKLNGKATKVSAVPGYIRYRDKEIAKLLDKKNAIASPTSPLLTTLAQKKDEAIKAKEEAYESAKKDLDSVSTESGHAGLWFQLLITLIAKIDVYGYFLLRVNIKNRVLNKMHDILEEFNAVHQLSGVFQQFSRQTTQVLKAIGLASISVNNEISMTNRTLVSNSNRYLKSNKRMILALENAGIEAKIKTKDKKLEGFKHVEASYSLTGDERIDISGDEELQGAEELLTKHINELGYPHTVVFDESVKEGEIEGNIIRINPNFSEEDMIKILIHELAHYEAGTHKHDEKFKEGVEKVISKRENREFEPIKTKEYSFSLDRAMEVLDKYAMNETMHFTQNEIDYLIKRGAWDGKLKVSDYTELMNILDI